MCTTQSVKCCEVYVLGKGIPVQIIPFIRLYHAILIYSFSDQQFPILRYKNRVDRILKMSKIQTLVDHVGMYFYGFKSILFDKNDKLKRS